MFKTNTVLLTEGWNYHSSSEFSHFQAAVLYCIFGRDKQIKSSIKEQDGVDKLNGGNTSASSGPDLLISCLTFSRWMPKLYLCHRISEGRVAINFLSSLSSRIGSCLGFRTDL